jgi:hypothetical protein
MNKNYISLGSVSKNYFQKSVKNTQVTTLHQRKNFLNIWSTLMLIILFGGLLCSNAQSTANYAFSTNTTSSLAADANGNTVDMTAGTTLLVANSTDEGASSVTNIGFDFIFMGNLFTQFSASSNGIMQLGSTAVNSSTYVASGGSSAAPKLSAFGGDLQTGTAGKVHCKVVGTAPNRCLVVEFLNMHLYYSNGFANDATFQIRLYETTGVVQYVYGTVAVSSISGFPNDYSPSIGFSVGNATNAFGSVTFAAHTYNTTTSFTENPNSVVGTIANLSSTANGSRRAYVFTPPVAPSIPTTLTFSAIGSSNLTVNWIDNSTTEFRFYVTRATDAAFTTGVVNTLVPSTTVVGTGTTYSSTQTGLVANTLYFYRIQAVIEGSFSTGLVDSQSTLATATITASAGGLWSSSTTWQSGVLPVSVDSVIIPAGIAVVVDQVVDIKDITIDGIVQWNTTSNAMTLTGNLNVNASGQFLPYTTGSTGQTINIGGDFTNNGFVNLAFPSSSLVFNGSGSSLAGSGTFLGDATNGFIRNLTFSNLGSNAITTSQNLIVTSGLSHTTGTLNTNGKLIVDNTAQVFGQPSVNTGVQSITVTNAGSSYNVAPVVFGTAVTQYANALAATVGTRYVSGNNVYLCTAAGSFNATPPTSTNLQATFTTSGPTLLYIATVGTLGTNIPFNTALNTTAEYFHGDNVYQSLVTTAVSAAANYPVHTSGVVNNFLYLGSVAKATVGYDAASQSVRNLTLTQNGNGFTTAPSVAFSVGVAGGTGSGAAATAVVIQSIVGDASALFQKGGGAATITGGLTINSEQGATALATANGAPASAIEQSASGVGAISTTNGGLNYTVAPTVGFSLPTEINLVTNPGSSYAAIPTVTVTGGTLVSGIALTSSNFTITVNNGTVQSVYLTSGTGLYSTLPTLTFSAGSATLAFPAGCLPTATATIGANGQISNFTVTNVGYGYNAAPTVGLSGGTFTTAATAPTASVALYNLITTPTTVVQGEDAAIPSNRKINNLSIAGNGLGMNITSNLTLFGTSPLSLAASGNGAGNIFDLGGSSLIFTFSTYTGTNSIVGVTNTFIRNGAMVLTTRGGSATLSYPYSGTVTLATGSGTLGSGSSATRISVSPTTAPTGTVNSGTLTGNRGYRIVRNAGAVYGTNPTVTLGYTLSDVIAATNPTIFIAQAAALTGPWTVRSATSGTGTLTLPGSRTTATTAPGPIVMTGDDYFGFASTLVSYVSAATGNWEVPATWSGGLMPPTGVSNEAVFINNNHIVTTTATGNFAKNVTIYPGGTLVVGASSDLTIGFANKNNFLNNNGTLTISGGTLNLNGNYAGLSGSVFNQSGGNFIIDGNNNGDLATSVGTATPLFQIVTATGTVTAGNLTIVDPPAANSSARCFQMNFTSGNLQWGAGHTLAFGNGLSTDSSANTAGFQFDTYVGIMGTQSMVGSVLVNAGSGTNRWVTTSNSAANGSYVKGNLTINNSSQLRDVASGGRLVVAGNIINNGTMSMTSVPLSFGTYTGSTLGSASSTQSVSGSGIFRNLLTLPTHNFTSLIMNNANGVTFASNNITVSGGLTVNGSSVINFASGKNLTLGGTVTVAASSTLTFENNANLIQTGTGTNVGNIIVKRNTSMKRLNYTYWSSPVADQNVMAFSPATLINRFYTFSETTNAFVPVATTTTFEASRGYAIRAPNTHPTTNTAWTGTFTGVPNNDTVSFTTTITAPAAGSNGYNLVGNPYPSTVSGRAFIAANPGSLNFWTHSVYQGGLTNYATYTNAGGTAAALGGPKPNGIIQVGQGFMYIPATAGSKSFTNAMRVIDNSNQFFRTSNSEQAVSEFDKYWLNATGTNHEFSQILVGYFPNGTNNFDGGLDGKQINSEGAVLSSLIGGEAMAIQGRGNFVSSDVVPLGFKANTAGNYTLAIDQKEGLFNNGQNIFLKDNLTGTLTNLQNNAYNFVSDAGTFNNRFEIVYESVLSNNNTFNASNVVVFNNNNQLNINATEEIKTVKVFDMRGRAIFEKKAINSKATVLEGFAPQQQVLIVQITDNENRVVTKKVIF